MNFFGYVQQGGVTGSGSQEPRPRCFELIELRFVEVNAAPSNQSMELTIKSVTPFARAKAAPLLLAAHARC